MTQSSAVEIKRCRSCNAQIVWAETDRGKKMPVDLERSSQGTLLVYAEVMIGSEELISPCRVRVATPDERSWLKGSLWISHFATCPNAAAHRKDPDDARGG